MTSARRPTTVTVVAVLAYISAALYIVGGIVILIASGSAEVDAVAGGRTLVIVTGILAIVIGLITVFVARGLFHGSNIARVWVAGLQVIGALNGILSIVHGQVGIGAVHILLAIVVIVALYLPESNAFFGKPSITA